MKHILLSCWLVLCAAGLAIAAPAMNNDGHVLTQLWAQYESARSADRPQKEAEILSQIKEEARRRHLSVDFYDAATKYVQTVSRRDWKQREAATEALEKEVKTFDEPIVTFRWMASWRGDAATTLWSFVQDYRDGFPGRTEAFYTDISRYLGGCMPHFVRNDYEYVLWRILQGRSLPEPANDPVCQALRQELAGRYPAVAALDYYLLRLRSYPQDRRHQQKQELQALAAQYAGRAAALYPRCDLLSLRLDSLQQAHAGESDYLALYADAQALEKERKAFKGDEALVAQGCTVAKSLLQTLSAKGLQVHFAEGKVQVLLQNLPAASLTLYQSASPGVSGKTALKTWQLKNPKGSFFVADTVEVTLPKLADGTYTVEAVQGKQKAEDVYEQYTLSIATRCDARGWSAYVTDYKSGKPLDKVKLVLSKSGKEVASATVTQQGFTLLPKAMQKRLDGNAYYMVRAESGDRRSPEVSVRDYTYRSGNDGLGCHIYRDRGAYNPGDTLRFKAVVYEGDPMLKLSVCQNKSLTVALLDAESNELARQVLQTNAFGSASGAFVLPKGLRNGYFGLRVDAGGKTLAWQDFRVDEFVLPSFDLAFDPYDQLYLEGDEVPVSGLLTAYSGHPLSGARVALKVTRYGSLVLEQDLEVGADNRFATAFRAQRGEQEIEATVTDATGETRSFHTSLYVGSEIRVTLNVTNQADASLILDREPSYRWGHYGSVSQCLVTEDRLQLTLKALDAQGRQVPLPLTYTLEGAEGEEPVHSGSVLSGDPLELSLEGLPAGMYTLTATTSAKRGEKILEAREQCKVLLLRPAETTLPEGVARLFAGGRETLGEGEPIGVRLASAPADAYVVMTLYGNNKEVLVSRQLLVKAGQVEDIALEYKASYPDAVRLHLFYFLDGEAIEYDRQYRRAVTRVTLPLSCTRFQDKAYPGTQYSVRFQTDPGAEVLVAAWDKSLDAIARNPWPLVSLADYSVPGVSIHSACGVVGSGNSFDGPVLYSIRGTRAGAATPMMMAKNARVESDMVMEEMAVDSSVNAPDGGSGGDEQATVPVRSVFSTALTFQPHLRPSADGTLDVSFAVSDKLSTYYVAVYAHDPAMRNALLQQEMLVSLPVKVSVQEPRYLYVGDVCELALTVSSISEEPVSGRLSLRSEAGSLGSFPVTLQPGETLTRCFRVEASAPGTLVLTGSFQADEFSDAIRVEVPVYPACQLLTEAHSAVLRAGMSREALLAELRARFVNIPGAEAILKEITVLDMVRDAIPDHVEPAGKDVLSLSEAWYVRLLASRLGGCQSAPELPDEELLAQILACRNADGGFGWFEGMSSSPLMTAVVLERMARLRDRGFEVPELSASVKYLDQQHFATTLPIWQGYLSDAQYMRVRALYGEVPFAWKPVSKTDKKRLSNFTKEAQAYLVPARSAGRGLEGQILSKARRILTLRDLQERPGGLALASAWGISFAAKSRLENSLQADVTSLLEYAVEHRDGGWYYPNAVMPWRGLLESEAYAHALLCDLLSSLPEGGEKADGIRLWLMLQKETQRWDSDPAFVDAITSILDGSEAVLQTRVLALSGRYEAPFQAVKAAGNGFSIARKFYREQAGAGEKLSLEEITPGTPVSVGDKIVVKYEIWNGENRSFVKVDAGREASLRPVQQLSGAIGFGFIVPHRSGYVWSFTPQGYRNVRADRTEYFFDSYPEEKTSLTEEFFVTQAGVFVAPVVTIESLYAPHYRANDGFREALPSARQ